MWETKVKSVMKEQKERRHVTITLTIPKVYHLFVLLLSLPSLLPFSHPPSPSIPHSILPYIPPSLHPSIPPSLPLPFLPPLSLLFIPHIRGWWVTMELVVTREIMESLESPEYPLVGHIYMNAHDSSWLTIWVHTVHPHAIGGQWNTRWQRNERKTWPHWTQRTQRKTCFCPY